MPVQTFSIRMTQEDWVNIRKGWRCEALLVGRLVELKIADTVVDAKEVDGHVVPTNPVPGSPRVAVAFLAPREPEAPKGSSGAKKWQIFTALLVALTPIIGFYANYKIEQAKAATGATEQKEKKCVEDLGKLRDINTCVAKGGSVANCNGGVFNINGPK
jgi:hypothetical protein